MVERREFVSALPRLISVAQPLRSTDLFSPNKPEVCRGCFAIGAPTFLLEMFALASLCRVSPLTEATKRKKKTHNITSLNTP